MKISFNFENLNLVFQIQNDMTVSCAYFGTRFSLLSSKIISSAFFRVPQIANIFQQINIIKKQVFINFNIFSWSVVYNKNKLDLLDCYHI